MIKNLVKNSTWLSSVLPSSATSCKLAQSNSQIACRTKSTTSTGVSKGSEGEEYPIESQLGKSVGQNTYKLVNATTSASSWLETTDLSANSLLFGELMKVSII